MNSRLFRFIASRLAELPYDDLTCSCLNVISLAVWFLLAVFSVSACIKNGPEYVTLPQRRYLGRIYLSLPCVDYRCLAFVRWLTEIDGGVSDVIVFDAKRRIMRLVGNRDPNRLGTNPGLSD